MSVFRNLMLAALSSAVLIAPVQVRAEEMTMQRLEELCDAPEHGGMNWSNGFCTGYAVGAAAAIMDRLKLQGKICVPDNTFHSLDLLNTFIRSFYRTHPQYADELAGDVIIFAFMETFPCH